MRTFRTATAALSLLLIGACDRSPDQKASLPDDLKRDLAAASAPGGDLAIAPQSYRRMRFVSDIEQAKTSTPARRPKVSHHAVPPTIRPSPASDEATTTADDAVGATTTEAAAPAPVTESPEPQPAVAVAQQPAPEPVAQATSESGPSVGDQGHGGGLGGLLGGIIGAVVIRGGHGGVDKCDPRYDGRARPTVIDRPDFGLPLPTGRPTFPGSGRR